MRFFSLAGLLLLLGANQVVAQDAQPRTEPRFPHVCTTLAAPLSIDADGPVAGGTTAEEDRESRRQTADIDRELRRCARLRGTRGGAVRLAAGTRPDRVAFLIEPLTLPENVSLIVDGGVTVFASRNPRSYQVPLGQQGIPGRVRCGAVGAGWPIYGGCRPLVTLSSGSGVYGYGVIDGQGQRPMIGRDASGATAWWDLLQQKKACGASCEQASPPMIFGGLLPNGEPREPLADLTLYKITLRNPQFHTVSLGGNGITVWGIKVQAPWNVPNSDGFDLHGRNILVKDVTVANGDQDIVLTTSGSEVTRDVTVDGATLYSKGGVAVLGDGAGFANVVVSDIAITGRVTSFKQREHGALINGVDPRRVVLPGSASFLKSYGQALPTATGDLQGIQIDLNLGGTSTDTGAIFRRLSFQSVCMQDIVRPITIAPSKPFAEGEPLPLVEDVTFSDIHVLAPSQQFPALISGRVSKHLGGYQIEFIGSHMRRFFNQITLQNVVFDDAEPHRTSIRRLVAVRNILKTIRAIYPPQLNGLDGSMPELRGWKMRHNSYARKGAVSDPNRGYPCPASRWPFLTGELYVSLPSDRSPGAYAGARPLVVAAGASVALSAVVQPAMSQTTWFAPDSYGQDPGLLAIAAPPLAAAVEFFEGATRVGRGRLAANGTLATAVIPRVSPGRHTYTARYPGDAHYRPYSFGSVVVDAR